VYLLDTNIVSLLDPRRRFEAGALIDWIEHNGRLLYLSVLTLMELEVGVQGYERRGASSRARELRAFREAVVTDAGDRVLPISTEAALEAGRLWAAALPVEPGRIDLIIAATAKVHGLTVLTRNLRHFRPTGVACLDPLTTPPPDV
jgi:toxin FitB